MKKKWSFGIVVTTMIICGVLWYYRSLNYGKMDIYNTHSITFGDYHEENITIIVNKLYVKDFQSCAEEIVEKCRNNAFKSIIFRYDTSIPNELHVTVYRTKQDIKKHKILFSFSYKQDEKNSEYNIVEHPEKFRLKIDE